jgi:hypothetical protein
MYFTYGKNIYGSTIETLPAPLQVKLPVRNARLRGERFAELPDPGLQNRVRQPSRQSLFSLSLKEPTGEGRARG